MKTLKVFQHGQEIASLPLTGTDEFFVGRGSSCAIQLPNEKGISRQHLRIHLSDQVWMAQLVSKFGEIIVDGSPYQEINLEQQQRFSIPPFDFQLVDEQNSSQQPNLEVESGHLDSAEQDNSFGGEEGLNLSEDQEDSASETAPESQPELPPANANFEATQVGRISLMPFVRILNETTGTDDLLKLEGSSWIIGRHPSSEIHIDDSAVSRKHFEINRDDSGYTIVDLESSNGTTVNGKVLDPNQAARLNSGDEITIRHLKIRFEVRDPAFKDRVKDMVPLDSYSLSGHSLPGIDLQFPQNSPQPFQHQGPAVVRLDQPKTGFDLQNPKVRRGLMFGAPALLVLALIFGGDKDPAGEIDLNSEKAAPPSAEVLAEAKHLFEISKSHYQTAKYEFCLSQLERLHTLVPSYESSKDIENLCRQGLELVRINADRERKERERLEVESKIKAVVENCRSQLDKFETTDEVSACLTEAIERSPEHPDVVALLSLVSNKEEMEKERQQRAADRARRRRIGLSVYNSAKQLTARGKLQSAINKYKQFLRGNYDLSNEESAARSAIQDLERKISSIAQASVAKCSESAASEKFREAVQECSRALRIDPDNQKAEELKSRSLASLNRSMKTLYEDSILEESLGNLDAAKEKWSRIIKESVPDDSYYKKAKSKLRKYGIVGL